jgi:hypothetical protein
MRGEEGPHRVYTPKRTAPADLAIARRQVDEVRY